MSGLTKWPADLSARFGALREQLQGEIRLDAVSRWNYSTDASIYQLMPEAVIIPAAWDDVHLTLALAREQGLPLTARGGGTSLGGQAIGHGLHLDLGRHFRGISELNLEEGSVRVQPGVVLDQLNAFLAPHGYWFGPDVAPANRATLGGMISNNAAGARSIVYGKTCEHVLELDVLLSDGSETTLRPLSPALRQQRMQQPTLEGQIWRQLHTAVTEHASEIRARYPRIMRRVSGYNLDAFGDPGADWNLSALVTGSEGTLALIRSAKVKICRKPPCRGLLVVYCRDLDQALLASHALLASGPCASEVLDQLLLQLTRENPGFANKLRFMEQEAAVLLLVEYQAETEHALQQLLAGGKSLARRELPGVPVSCLTDPRAQADAWAVRKAGLPLLYGLPGRHKPVAFVEDTAVAPERLQDFIREFDQIVRAHDTQAAYYAHASVGCIHIRPLLDLQQASEVAKMRALSEQVLALVMRYGGAMSGEHGDGLARSEFNPRLFGPVVYGLFQALKATWDPQQLLNPGKIVNAPAMDQNLRYGPAYQPREPETVLRFARQESYRHQIELCNGCGGCRKLDPGLMCPPYRVSRDERDSTRARANALRLLLLEPQLDAADRQELALTLESCIGCKGCKAECPSRVDLARLKSEFLHHWQQEHGLPLRSRLLSRVALLGRLGSASAPLSNALLNSRPLRWLLARTLGLEARRPLPRFARRPLTRQARPTAAGERGRVLLFPDCFANYHHPQAGLAAVRVIEALGYRVELPPALCCGRPALSLGRLDLARHQARQWLDHYQPLLAQGVMLVGLEPSCLLSFRDEYPDLWPEAEALAQQTRTLPEWLVEVCAGRTDLPFQRRERLIALHEHCHQKALVGPEPSLAALRLVPGYQPQLIQSGCCGMAGAFGYAREHYDMSCAIAGEHLLPALAALPEQALVVVNGASCWQQIADLSARQPVYLAEALAAAL